MVQFNCNYVFSTPGGKFEADTASPGKQVEHGNIFKINAVDQNIEKAFLGQVSGWPDRQPFWGMDLPCPMCSAYYSQNGRVKSV